MYKQVTINKYGTRNGVRKYENGVITEETPLIESGQFNTKNDSSDLGNVFYI